MARVGDMSELILQQAKKQTKIEQARKEKDFAMFAMFLQFSGFRGSSVL